MSSSTCPFCKEEIRAGAIKCKHCSSTIVDMAQAVEGSKQREAGTLWLPIPSMVIGILCFLMLFDDSHWDVETIIGLFSLAGIGFVIGGVSISTQKVGKGMAVAGAVLSSISLLAGVGLLVE